MPVTVVEKMFQPPSAGGFFTARRDNSAPQSMAARSTLMPAWRSHFAADKPAGVAEDVAGLVENLDGQVRILLQLIDQVLRRNLVEIDFPGLQRAQSGLFVGNVLEGDAIELDHLPARHGRGRLGARYVVRIAIVDVAV